MSSYVPLALRYYNVILIGVLIASAYIQWTRRTTWTCRWESGTTFCGICCTIGLTLGSPFVREKVWPELGLMDELLPIPQILGDSAILLGMAAFLYSLAHRLDIDEDERARWLNRNITLPCTLISPTMIGAFYSPLCSDTVIDSLIAAAFAWWIWQIGRLLVIIYMTDPRSRNIMRAYIACCGLALLSGAERILGIVYGIDYMRHAWGLTAFAACGFGITSAISWQLKQRHLKTGLWRKVRRGRATHADALKTRKQPKPEMECF
ncbi:membrane protein [Mycobacterium phage DuncansLeg]|nr:membrane protein [Mycobacterium phage DuncansLeg]